MAMEFPSIEHKAGREFFMRFMDGAYGQQRLGQAFYNEFNLHKLADQKALHNLYEKDGKEAKALIAQLFNIH